MGDPEEENDESNDLVEYVRRELEVRELIQSWKNKNFRSLNLACTKKRRFIFKVERFEKWVKKDNNASQILLSEIIEHMITRIQVGDLQHLSSTIKPADLMSGLNNRYRNIRNKLRRLRNNIEGAAESLVKVLQSQPFKASFYANWGTEIGFNTLDLPEFFNPDYVEQLAKTEAGYNFFKESQEKKGEGMYSKEQLEEALENWDFENLLELPPIYNMEIITDTLLGIFGAPICNPLTTTPLTEEQMNKLIFPILNLVSAILPVIMKSHLVKLTDDSFKVIKNFGSRIIGLFVPYTDLGLGDKFTNERLFSNDLSDVEYDQLVSASLDHSRDNPGTFSGLGTNAVAIMPCIIECLSLANVVYEMFEQGITTEAKINFMMAIGKSILAFAEAQSNLDRFLIRSINSERLLFKGLASIISIGDVILQGMALFNAIEGGDPIDITAHALIMTSAAYTASISLINIAAAFGAGFAIGMKGSFYAGPWALLIATGIGLAGAILETQVDKPKSDLEEWMRHTYFGVEWESNSLEELPDSMFFRWVDHKKRGKNIPNIERQISEYFSMTCPLKPMALDFQKDGILDEFIFNLTCRPSYALKKSEIRLKKIINYNYAEDYDPAIHQAYTCMNVSYPKKRINQLDQADYGWDQDTNSVWHIFLRDIFSFDDGWWEIDITIPLESSNTVLGQLINSDNVVWMEKFPFIIRKRIEIKYPEE